MEIVPPDLEYVPVALAADSSQTRSLGRPPVISSAVELGFPVAQPITEELTGEDEALRQFLRHNVREWQFHLVHLGCSFHPDDGMQIAKARVAVRLNPGEAGGTSAPAIVWSLDPQRTERPVDISQSVKLGAKLAFAEAALEMTSEGKGAEVFIEAYGLQQSACSWEFRRTARDKVSGTYRLALIVRSFRGTSASGEVTVDATVSYRRFSLMPFRSELARQPPVAFVIGARSTLS